MASGWDVGEVYEDLAPHVLGFFRGRGARDPEALTGDVFVSVTTGLGRFRGNRAALRRWVFTIAHHRLVDEYRRRGRVQEFAVADVVDAGIEDGMPVDAQLLEALSMLSDEQREVVVMRFIADLSVADVAKIIGKRAGAVKMLQARGLAALAAQLSTSSE